MWYISIPFPENNRIDVYYQVKDNDCLGRVCFYPVLRKVEKVPVIGNSFPHGLRVCGKMWDDGCPESDKELRVHIQLRDNREKKGWITVEL